MTWSKSTRTTVEVRHPLPKPVPHSVPYHYFAQTMAVLAGPPDKDDESLGAQLMRIKDAEGRSLPDERLLPHIGGCTSHSASIIRRHSQYVLLFDSNGARQVQGQTAEDLDLHSCVFYANPGRQHPETRLRHRRHVLLRGHRHHRAHHGVHPVRRPCPCSCLACPQTQHGSPAWLQQWIVLRKSPCACLAIEPFTLLVLLT